MPEAAAGLAPRLSIKDSNAMIIQHGVTDPEPPDQTPSQLLSSLLEKVSREEFANDYPNDLRLSVLQSNTEDALVSITSHFGK